MLEPVFLEVVWRIPNAPMFVVGILIVGWGVASGALAFTGSQSSGLPEIHFPGHPANEDETLPQAADAPGDDPHAEGVAE